MRTRKPTHPGAILREDVLPELNMSVSGFARSLGVSRQTLHAVLAERSGISPEMALRLGVLLGNGAQLWVDMQTKYDLWQAELSCMTCCEGCSALPSIMQLFDNPKGASTFTSFRWKKQFEMTTDATLTSKDQTTIPKEIRESLRMKAGDRMTFTLMPR